MLPADAVTVAVLPFDREGQTVEGSFHVPVLSEQVVSLLVTDPEGTYVDGTIGGGGHAEAICKMLRGRGRLIGFDLDDDAIAYSTLRLEQFVQRLVLLRTNFIRLADELHRLGIDRIHGVLLDLGVSSFQIDRQDRGFSFRGEGRVDMRMDRRQHTTGWDVVNSYTEKHLATIIRTFGEERHAGRIARKIVQSRPVNSTHELRDIVGLAVGRRFLTKSLARVFQAIRIEVNQELQNLQLALEASTNVLVPGGRVAVIAYHSLEDRMVKNFFRRGAESSLMRAITKKCLMASDQEVEQNPRARSARLRVAERLGAP